MQAFNCALAGCANLSPVPTEYFLSLNPPLLTLFSHLITSGYVEFLLILFLGLDPQRSTTSNVSSAQRLLTFARRKQQ